MKKIFSSPRILEVRMNLRKIQKLLVLWLDAKPCSPYLTVDLHFCMNEADSTSLGSALCIVKILMSDFLTISASTFVVNEQSVQLHVSGCLSG